MNMPVSLSLLLDGLIDYAGLFPPATLEMSPMVSTYRRVMLDERGWMVGRVIVPVAQLEEFEVAAAKLFPDEEEADPWCISALSRPCHDSHIESDFADIAAFNKRHATHEAGRAIIDVVEMNGGAAKDIDTALDVMPDDLFPFVEIPIDQDVRGILAVLAGSEAAAKIRTGGVQPELYPGVGAVSAFISSAAAAGVPFKATAGMHHPLPTDHPSLPVRQLGFLNVFLASAAAMAHELDAAEIETMLDIDDVSAFRWTDDAATLGDVTVSADDIEEARLSFAISYGSCSVDEPWEELESLGLLAPDTKSTSCH